MRIAFLGLGHMGAPMAANLARAGHRVAGFDPVPEACARAAGLGLHIAATAGQAVATAEAVITMLPAGQHVRAAYETLLPAAQPGTLVIDCSTIDVADARHAHTLSHAAEMPSLDAPVSGGVGGATAGTLTFMCGGSETAFARAQPLLAAMGRRIVHCGGAGAGQAAKICNNLILGITMAAVSEAFVLAESLGLAAEKLFDVAANASGQCWALTTYCPVPGLVTSSPANTGYRPGFATELMLKDLRLAQAAAAAHGATLPMGAAAADLFAHFAESGGAGQDFSAIITHIAALSHHPPAANRSTP